MLVKLGEAAKTGQLQDGSHSIAAIEEVGEALRIDEHEGKPQPTILAHIAIAHRQN